MCWYAQNVMNMILKLEDNKGHIILDRDTGRILSVVVHNVVEGKQDFITLLKYKKYELIRRK